MAGDHLETGPGLHHGDTFDAILDIEHGPEAGWKMLKLADKDYLDNRYIVKGFERLQLMNIRFLDRKLSRLEYLMVVAGKAERETEYEDGVRDLFGRDSGGLNSDGWNLQPVLGRTLQEYSPALHSLILVRIRLTWIRSSHR